MLNSVNIDISMDTHYHSKSQPIVSKVGKLRILPHRKPITALFIYLPIPSSVKIYRWKKNWLFRQRELKVNEYMVGNIIMAERSYSAFTCPFIKFGEVIINFHQTYYQTSFVTFIDVKSSWNQAHEVPGRVSPSQF